MDYRRIYDALMSTAQRRAVPACYTEKHHIIPRSLGGDESDTNMVTLTAREHFVAHKLLPRFLADEGDSEGSRKMVYAVWILQNRLGHDDRYHVSSHEFAKTRELYNDHHPNKCPIQKAKMREKFEAGELLQNGEAISIGVKNHLRNLTAEQRKARMANSALNADQVKRAQAIKHGKSSLLRMTYDGRVVDFQHYESLVKTGFDYGKIKYWINHKKHQGTDPTSGAVFEYLQKYDPAKRSLDQQTRWSEQATKRADAGIDDVKSELVEMPLDMQQKKAEAARKASLARHDTSFFDVRLLDGTLYEMVSFHDIQEMFSDDNKGNKALRRIKNKATEESVAGLQWIDYQDLAIRVRFLYRPNNRSLSEPGFIRPNKQ